ncbi:putative serine/threonine-protein kinase [Trichinella spiralis]|uniref:Serine/threonine-protein kinase n=1 Tax=Trichinella spiralis TaxID=6334 RepID=A0ABR3K545_TRISP
MYTKVTVPDCTLERSLSIWQWYDPKCQGEDQSWKPGHIVTKPVSGGTGKHSSNAISCRAGKSAGTASFVRINKSLRDVAIFMRLCGSKICFLCG